MPGAPQIMGLMPKEYVSYSEGVYRIAGTRISLDSLVYLFREGMSAEMGSGGRRRTRRKRWRSGSAK